MVCRVLGALLCDGALTGGPPEGYAYVFYFFLCFGEIFKYAWPIGEPFGLF